MTAPAGLNAICLFCDDVREEKSGVDTIVGVYPDNANIPAASGRLPRLALYARIAAPIETVPASIGMRIEFPWDEEPLNIPGNPPAQIQQDAELVRAEGGSVITFILKLSFTPFLVKSPGRVKAVAIVDGEEILCGALNFKLAAPAETGA